MAFAVNLENRLLLFPGLTHLGPGTILCKYGFSPNLFLVKNCWSNFLGGKFVSGKFFEEQFLICVVKTLPGNCCTMTISKYISVHVD